MTAAADLVLTDAEVHTLADPGRVAEAVAVRDGAIVRVGSAYEVGFLAGVETAVVELGGRIVVPGFVDAHTHLTTLGRYLVHADLRGATGPDECVDRLRAADDGDGWVLGFGFDESGWDDPRYLSRDDLDRVTADRPVAAFREDMHVVALNGVALDRHREAMPAADVLVEAGRPTGVVVESAAGVVYDAIEPDAAELRDLLLAAQAHAHRKGVTGVHEMVRRSRAPRVYRELELADELALRVRLDYWDDHLDAALETGLRTNHGSDRVRVGAIKVAVDGSVGGRTAKLSEPYADAGSAGSSTDANGTDEAIDATGRWLVPPDAFRDLVRRADRAGFQIAAHAIGDAAIDAVLDAYAAAATDAAAARHRIEHAELLTDAQIERLASLGAVASVQPNFLKWAGDGGLYEVRLGPDRAAATNRFADLIDAGVPLAFGSDCMPLDPLYGIHRTVNASTAARRLSVTRALRAYTSGAAYAGFDEDRVGTIEPGKRADLVALDRSPWEAPAAIEDIGVALTVVDGSVVYDGR